MPSDREDWNVEVLFGGFVAVVFALAECDVGTGLTNNSVLLLTDRF